MVQNGWKSVAKVFVLAFILDSVYQWIALRWFYPGEALLVAFILAIVPYLIVRGPVNRLARSSRRTARRHLPVMTAAAAPALDTGTRLAVDRTRLAYERTMMAWIRTAASLISFGFTIYKFFQLELKKPAAADRLIGSRGFALIMIGTGLVALLLAGNPASRKPAVDAGHIWTAAALRRRPGGGARGDPRRPGSHRACSCGRELCQHCTGLTAQSCAVEVQIASG